MFPSRLAAPPASLPKRLHPFSLSPFTFLTNALGQFSLPHMKILAPLAALSALLVLGCSSPEETPAPESAPVTYTPTSLAKLADLPATTLGQTIETQGLLRGGISEVAKGVICFELYENLPNLGPSNGLLIVADAKWYDLVMGSNNSYYIGVRGKMIKESTISMKSSFLQAHDLEIAEET